MYNIYYNQNNVRYRYLQYNIKYLLNFIIILVVFFFKKKIVVIYYLINIFSRYIFDKQYF